MLFDLETLTKVDREITRSTMKGTSSFFDDFVDVFERSKNNKRSILTLANNLRTKTEIIDKIVFVEDKTNEQDKALQIIDYFNNQLSLYRYLMEVLIESGYKRDTKSTQREWKDDSE